MGLDIITLGGDVSLEVVVRYLRLRSDIPARTNRLIVVERNYVYRGEICLADLLTHDPSSPVRGVIFDTGAAIPAGRPISCSPVRTAQPPFRRCRRCLRENCGPNHGR